MNCGEINVFQRRFICGVISVDICAQWERRQIYGRRALAEWQYVVRRHTRDEVGLFSRSRRCPEPSPLAIVSSERPLPRITNAKCFLRLEYPRILQENWSKVTLHVLNMRLDSICMCLYKERIKVACMYLLSKISCVPSWILIGLNWRYFYVRNFNCYFNQKLIKTAVNQLYTREIIGRGTRCIKSRESRKSIYSSSNCHTRDTCMSNYLFDNYFRLFSLLRYSFFFVRKERKVLFSLTSRYRVSEQCAPHNMALVSYAFTVHSPGW